jgi:Zn-dependent membrane protease YugP
MFYYFDPLFLILMGIGLLLSMLASAAVHSAFARYREVPTRRGITGAEVARLILQANGIQDVGVEAVPGNLTDHYDPSSKTLRLSEPIYGSNSVAAVGVAAHEVGHAIQHANGYVPLKFRSAWVPVAGLGTNLGFFLLLIASALGGFHRAPTISWLAVVLFGTTTVFTLVTMPVEFDASRRALLTLEHGGVLTADEMPGVRRVLGAAALTYVAAFLASLLQLVYWLIRLGLLGGRRDD